MSQDLSSTFQPLAARLRPETLDDFAGQEHLLGPNKPLRQAIETGMLHSMIFWGPPGTGKTTLARLIAKNSCAHFENISAVTAGLKDVRAIIEIAHEKQRQGQATVLFVDEVHRFNKAQQDAFLPPVEEGLLILIGATTENPSFELNSALLSRARIYVLKALKSDALLSILRRAIHQGFPSDTIVFADSLQEKLIQAADGDARRLLNLFELAVDLAEKKEDQIFITEEILKELWGSKWRRFDDKGENFYDQISALHKSVRGSSPDAALYWFARMIEGGCDPLYLARRAVRMASEDIGNADPRALTLALHAWDVQERLGSPEGELAIAQAIVYMACAPKSNAVYVALNEVMADIKKGGSLEVPLHLRNAPTALMKSLDYGRNYHYPHDVPRGYVPNEQYFPDGMTPKRYYRPVNRGLEIQIAEKLAQLRAWDKESDKT